MKRFLTALLLLYCVSGQAAGGPSVWRQASEKELRELIPARATVEHERIETEFRTASGVTDGRGKFIAGVVMITAGYAAEGKYSHFFITQATVKMGQVVLAPGEYVFGFKRVGDEEIEIKFYEAANGRLLGAVSARREAGRGPVRSLMINPAVNGKGTIQIGRFSFSYQLSE